MSSTAALLLRQAADCGSLDEADWPRVLQHILRRLDDIVNNEFPTAPPPHVSDPPASTQAHQRAPLSSEGSFVADTENGPPPTPPSARSRPPATQGAAPPHHLPPATLSFYTNIRSTLSTDFTHSPPYTIQRLAELVLEPKCRYRFLHPYLRALDRVISVTSATTSFPLPTPARSSSTSGLLNGSSPPTQGGDAGLGGALLIPIPWLRSEHNAQSELVSECTELVDGPHGTGRIETVSVMNGLAPATTISPSSPVTSTSATANEGFSEYHVPPDNGGGPAAELSRQIHETGVEFPDSSTILQDPVHILEASGSNAVASTTDRPDEVPRPRGPDLIDMTDTGPQSPRGPGLDIEAAVGRRAVRNEPRELIKPCEGNSKMDDV